MYILLFCFWILLNGKITLEICLLGLAVTAAIGLMLWPLMHYTPKKELRLLKKVPLFVIYAAVLFWEIVKANLAMFRYILNPRKPAGPTLITFDAQLSTDFGRFMLANSITLTPGTITVSTDGNRFTVHCLEQGMLDCSPDGVFQRWIRRLEA